MFPVKPVNEKDYLSAAVGGKGVKRSNIPSMLSSNGRT